MPPPLWPVVLAGIAAFINLYATQPLLPLLMRVFGATPFAVSLTVTASTMAVALAAPLAGRFGDRVGRRRVIVTTAGLLALATGLTATSRSLTELIAWRFVQGLLTPGVFAVTVAYIHARWPASHSGRATAAYVSGTVIGGFSGRAVAGVMATAFSWQAAFVALAAMIAVTSAALWRWLPPEDPGSHGGDDGPRHETGAVREARPRDPRASVRPAGSVWRLLRNRQLLATNAIGFCMLFTLVATFTYVTFYLSAPPFGLSTLALAWLFVVYLVGAAVTPVAGWWTDTVGHRAALGAAVAIGLCGAASTLVHWLPAVVAGLALVATGVFVAQATASSYIGAVTADDRGLAVGLYSTCYYLGGSAGAALPAAIWNMGGWTGTVLLVMAVQAVTFVVAWTGWGPAARSR